MKKILLLIAITCFSNVTQAQTTTDTTITELKPVEKNAEFPGGTEAWKQHIAKNLKADIASKYYEPKKGELLKIVVDVWFLVYKDGSVQEVTVNSTTPENVPQQIKDEAIRVIKMSPNWIPAEQFGRKGIYRQKQKIAFVVTGE